MSTQAAGDSNKLKDGLELTEHNISSLEGQPQGNDVVAIHTDLKETSEDTQETEKRSPPAGTQPTNETGEPESPQATVNGMISANPPVPNERKAPQSSQANSESSSETADVTIPFINGRPKKVHPPTPWSKWQKYMILSVLTAILVTHIILVQDNPPPVKPSPLQFQHAFFHLKTRGYTELEKDTYLRWKRDESQDEGNIKLRDETSILITQDGVYQINSAVQLFIPEDTHSRTITLMLERKKGAEYEYIKRSSCSLNVSENFMIQSSFAYQFKRNDAILLRMNMAKFISRNTPSSYLSITSLYTIDQVP
ncbi:uncharacterized protein LOC115224014 isoform X2 [Octopus sinensis]|uniref:Uncharacterized protein LOC115224014 isoform X2 n=1 Tax=Octopus sinensis TaxID=2607531 RepID=A0A7E6FLT2_9MOLL|nr:uncharacterized protein LOC115224014 isoform X2 [Octopus sinensis]